MTLDHSDVRTIEGIAEQLTEYGLSRNEAKVITFLAKRGAERASVVARALRLNRTETYRTLRNLQHRSLVEASLEQPVRFQAAPFSRCLELLIAERKSELAALEERGTFLERAFESVGLETGAPEFERFQVIEGRARIGQRLLFMHQNARLQVDSVVDPSDLSRGNCRLRLEAMSTLAKRGRRIRMITDINTTTARLVEEYHDLIRFRHLDLSQKPVPRVTIIDDTEALLGMGCATENTGQGSEQVSLWINSRSFVRSLRTYFSEIWARATPSPTRLEAVNSRKA